MKLTDRALDFRTTAVPVCRGFAGPGIVDDPVSPT
jgi:hypothetical protein